MTLSLLEVSPRAMHLPFIVAAAESWLGSYLDDREFWGANGTGRRVCLWLEEILRQEPALLDVDKSMRFKVGRLLAALVGLGVPEARRLEEALTGGLDSPITKQVRTQPPNRFQK